LRRQDYYSFIADIHRFRPLVVIVLAAVITAPSLVEMATEGLPALVVLLRLAEAMAFAGALVWAVSAVLLRYARTQAQSRQPLESEDDT